MICVAISHDHGVVSFTYMAIELPARESAIGVTGSVLAINLWSYKHPGYALSTRKSFPTIFLKNNGGKNLRKILLIFSDKATVFCGI